MTTALEVAGYIRSTGFNFSGEAQMQKILYYVQAWSLAWDGVPVFDEPVEAWKMGPVIRSVRRCLPHVRANADVALSDAQRATIEAVVQYYGKMTGYQLIELTHEEDPWVEAWGDRPADSRGADEISADSMRRAYTKQSAQHKGPRRRTPAPQPVDRAHLLARSSQVRKDWSRTLDLLSR